MDVQSHVEETSGRGQRLLFVIRLDRERERGEGKERTGEEGKERAREEGKERAREEGREKEREEGKEKERRRKKEGERKRNTEFWCDMSCGIHTTGYTIGRAVLH